MKKQIIIQKLSKYFDNYQIQKILQKITGLSKNQLFFCDMIKNINEEILNKYVLLGEKKYPFEYIIKEAEFFWEHFYVDENVLIPRNDTEVMVEKVLDLITEKTNNTILIDVWTGSSCIPIAILKNSNNIQQAHVIDISQKALDISKKNIIQHNLKDTIQQYNWDLLWPVINTDFRNKNIIVTANLPYIKNEDFENMSKETVLFEPNTALYWGPKTGFELYEKLLFQIEQLKEKNWATIDVFIEIWFDQKNYAQNYLENIWKKIKIFPDNSGIARCIHIKI